MDDSIYELKRPPGVRLNFGFVFFARLIWFLILLSIPSRWLRKDKDSPSRGCGKLKRHIPCAVEGAQILVEDLWAEVASISLGGILAA